MNATIDEKKLEPIKEKKKKPIKRKKGTRVSG